MQVAFHLAGEITQVLDAIPWVRCASGNVFVISDYRSSQKNLNKSAKSVILNHTT